MLYKAPDKLPNSSQFSNPSVFIAGGISNCTDWQSDIVSIIDTSQYDVVNPRRIGGFDITGETAEEQIKWEFDALNKVDGYIFWFPKETLCPITLFELGKALTHVEYKTIIVGWHPDYARGFDLKIQIDLVKQKTNSDLILHYDAGWENFCNAIKKEW